MSQIYPAQTVIEAWHQLLQDAGDRCHLSLDEEMQSYLVYMLMRHTEDVDIADNVMARRYLQGSRASGQQAIEQMRTVGDQCLLYCGFFTERCSRRNVLPRYYMDLGRTAYADLASRMSAGFAHMYEKLAQHFVALIDILLATRLLDPAQSINSALMIELARGCGSKHARRLLRDDHIHVMPAMQKRTTIVSR